MKLLRYWKPFAIGLIILYGSLTSGNKLPDVHLFNFKHFDKIVHFILYLIFTVTLYRVILLQTYRTKSINLLITVLIAVFYGLLMESFQYIFTDDRSPEFLDALANTLGSITGVIVYPVFVKLNIHKYL